MLKGNRGEWSEPYALFKLIADGNLSVGDSTSGQDQSDTYPIIRVTRRQGNRRIHFELLDEDVKVSADDIVYCLPTRRFQEIADVCLKAIQDSKSGEGTFGIQRVDEFLQTLSIDTLNAASGNKNDLDVQIRDPNSLTNPELGFSIKSQLGSPSTLVNAGRNTNICYRLQGRLDATKVRDINFRLEDGLRGNLSSALQDYGCNLEYSHIEDPTFRQNLITIDSSFDRILAELVLEYYLSGTNRVSELTSSISANNPLDYELDLQPGHYQLKIKQFLIDCALGMTPGKLWNKSYQATGGYLVVKKNGDVICYHFYFHNVFSEYLYNATKLDTPSRSKHGFGTIFTEKSNFMMRLNFQVRFTE